MLLSSNSVSRPSIIRKTELLSSQLRRRQLIGSHNVAIEVIRLMREIVAAAKYATFEELMNHIEEIGNVLQDAGPKELVITNITKRILKFLSEEYQTALSTYLTTTSSSSYPSTPYSVPQTPGWGVTGLETPGTFFPERGDPFAGRRIPSGSTGGSLGNIFDLLGHKNVAVGQHAGSSTNIQGGIGGSNNSSAPHSPHVPAAPPSPLLGHSSRSTTTTIRSPGPGAHTPNGLSPHVTTMLEEDFSKKSHSLKPVFIEAIQELMDEVEMTYRAVGEQSIDHIHSGEVIMTIGKSKTVEAFLKAASRKRKFTVIVAETAPSFSGRATALSLPTSGISVILIPDSSIFSLLPRCTKVLLGPHLISADGSLLSVTGSLPLAVAAKEMRVPVVVVGGMFKFSKGYLGEADWGARDLGTPEEVLESGWAGGRDRGDGGGGEEGEEEVEVVNPRWDVVPARLVDLFITNLGGHPSSLLYRLLSDMYL